jgi:hypothetical protein
MKYQGKQRVNIMTHEIMTETTEVTRPSGRFTWREVEVCEIQDYSEHATEFDSVEAIIEAIYTAPELFSDLSKNDNIVKVELVETETTQHSSFSADKFLLVTYYWEHDEDEDGKQLFRTAEIRWEQKSRYIGTLTTY